MATLIDQNGNRFDYDTLVEREQSIELDGRRFLAGKLADFTVENDPQRPPKPPRITRLAFLNRLTQTERIDIRTAAAAAPALADFMAMVDAASFIDLDFADTIEGVHFLETAGLIEEGRAAAILSAPVQDAERPAGL